MLMSNQLESSKKQPWSGYASSIDIGTLVHDKEQKEAKQSGLPWQFVVSYSSQALGNPLVQIQVSPVIQHLQLTLRWDEETILFAEIPFRSIRRSQIAEVKSEYASKALLLSLHHPPLLSRPDYQSPKRAVRTSHPYWAMLFGSGLGMLIYLNTEVDSAELSVHSLPNSQHGALKNLSVIPPMRTDLANAQRLSFSTRLMLEALYCKEVLCRQLTDARLLNALRSREEKDQRQLHAALQQLWEQPPDTALPNETFLTIIDHYKPGKSKRDDDDIAVMSVAALYVTPTRLVAEPPCTELSNRVLRHFEDKRDRFLRIHFVDEDFGPIGDALSPEILERVSSLLAGFNFDGREYCFLAYSQSQLRQQSCWFFANEEGKDGVTCDSIRQWCGDFSKIKVVGKYAMRLAQCFTATTDACLIHQNQWDWIPESTVMNYDNGKQHIFSDGVGRISHELAHAISAGKKYVPSAFQIRFGGFKGVVTTDAPETKTMIGLSGRAGGSTQLLLRKSMHKFSCPHSQLEIVSVAKCRSGTLNRQFVTLLSTLGIEDDVFIKLQDDVLSDLAHVTSQKKSAQKLVKPFSREFGNIFKDMLTMINHFTLDEPFLKTMLNCISAMILKELREQAKIPVPNSKLLLGVMDETSTLKPGQVYISGVRKGRVAVMRSPSLHPGDVRVLFNVNNLRSGGPEQLRHLIDVIVFPSRGDRPHPDEMSGGDLDGDLYWVTWDRGLIPKEIDNPAVYHRSPETTVDKVEIPHIQLFFLDFICNDPLGQIAHAHLAHASLSKDKARDEKCLRLCQVHSDAVDFPKTGRPSPLPPDLRPNGYPRFMGKKDQPTMKSDCVLNKLHRNVTKYQGKHSFKSYSSQGYDSKLFKLGQECFRDMPEVTKDLQNYNHELKKILDKFNVSESEALTGLLIQHGWNRRERQRVQQRSVELRREIRSLREQYQAKLEAGTESKVRGLKSDSFSRLLQRRAAAWYYAAHNASSSKNKMLSFAWIGTQVLCKIKENGCEI